MTQLSLTCHPPIEITVYHTKIATPERSLGIAGDHWRSADLDIKVWGKQSVHLERLTHP